MQKKSVALFVFLGLIGLWGNCSSASVDAQLVNTITIDLARASNIDIVYSVDNIEFFKGDGANIVVKEYMSENKKKYYAKVTHSDNSHVIQSGERPTSAAFSSYVEVYLPPKYTKPLSVKTESGNITCNTVKGNITISSASGNLFLTDITGYGNFNTDSGNIDLRFTEITGNVTASSKSGTVDFTAPMATSLNLSATTDSGSINNNFSGNIKTTENQVKWPIGDNPKHTVNLSTSSGNINIK